MAGLDPDLLALCPSKTVLFGCIDNGALGFERIETAEQVADRLLAVARHKLNVMVEGVRLARGRLSGPLLVGLFPLNSPAVKQFEDLQEAAVT